MVESKVTFKNSRINSKVISKQERLDHEQHYDIDGVTERNGIVVIPSNFSIQTHFSKRSDKQQKLIESKDKANNEIE